jgi:D-aminopeptidase
VAFSTANPGAADAKGLHAATYISNEAITTVFEATVQATEESITNALVAAETMTGANDLRITALPHDRLRTALQKYGRLSK